MARSRNQSGRDAQGQFTPGSDAARRAGRKGGKGSSGSTKGRGSNNGNR